jgi:cytochrome P450
VNIDTRTDGRKVCPFDHHSVEYAQGYREMVRQMREAGALLWSDSYGGFWIATDYDTIRTVLRDADTFTIEISDDTKRGGPLLPTPEEFVGMGSTPGLFFFVDGQRHDVARAALGPHYSKRRVATMTDMIRSHVDRVLDRVLPLGEFDIVDDLAMPVVAGVVTEHLGFGLDDPAALFRAMVSPGEVGNTDKQPPFTGSSRSIISFPDAVAYIGEIVQARRANPRDDVISALLQANDGQFSEAEVAGMCMQVILGALENPQALTAHCMIFLADRPQLRAQLRADPSQIPGFVVEALRYFNISMGVARMARRDVELCGMQIRKGDRILLPFPAANFDPRKFAHPDDFDVERPVAQNLALGAGTHTCLGQYLVNAMVGALIQALLERVEEYTIGPDKVIRNTDKSANDNFVRAPMRVDSQRVGAA